MLGNLKLVESVHGYMHRNAEEELQLTKVVRRHVACILRSMPLIDSQRIGNHSEGGPITRATLLKQITEHIPHYLRFVEQKRQAIG